MRREPTYAEALLWKQLRRLKDRGFHFRRQVPLGSYIVDFACHAARTIIELDGGIHALPAVVERDAKRETALRDGWRILRFTNTEAVDDAEGVVHTIARAL